MEEGGGGWFVRCCRWSWRDGFLADFWMRGVYQNCGWSGGGSSRGWGAAMAKALSPRVDGCISASLPDCFPVFSLACTPLCDPTCFVSSGEDWCSVKRCPKVRKKHYEITTVAHTPKLPVRQLDGGFTTWYTWMRQEEYEVIELRGESWNIMCCHQLSVPGVPRSSQLSVSAAVQQVKQ